jgi:hypothetical protein
MTKPEKARIINCSTRQAVECMFNPKEYTFSKQNKWSEKPVKGKGVSHLEFSGGEPASLKLQLLFDTYEAHGRAAAGLDVRQLTRRLWDMMKIDKKTIDPKTHKGQPPHVRFEWGKLWSFEAVIESISQKFTLFDSQGTPLRAVLDVSFKQIRDEGQYPRQNPTSGGMPGERLRIVRADETLAGIAYEEYGDPTVWRHLAETNNLADPRRLRVGQTLLIRPLPEV